jgi:hypothetical protein
MFTDSECSNFRDSNITVPESLAETTGRTEDPVQVVAENVVSGDIVDPL